MTIIWDFNGTLLDDMQVCVDCMNSLLEKRGLNIINLERYREIFTFPVRDYYLSLGFNFEEEPFEIPAHQFIDLYRENLQAAPLKQHAREMLDYFVKLGYRQVILSAMEQEFLEETIRAKGISGYFDTIEGITNHLADGKLELARDLISRLGREIQDIYLIGDTLHDLEVARDTGIPCVLVADGHQSFKRLVASGGRVVKDLQELKHYFPRNRSR